MKNKFIRLFAYLCFTLIFMSCNNIVTESESNSDLKSGNVIISLKSEPARTITPVNGKSYLDVAEWTVTFKETSANGYDDIVRKLTKESSVNVTIPVGAFDVILEGTIDATTPIPYYGKSSFEIKGNETEAVSVPVTVAPKKTEGGKGSFEYKLTVENLPSNPTLTPVLNPYNASNTPISLDAVLNKNVFTITGSEIPSGFYTFSIKLTADGKTKEIFDTFDNLVEILDDTKTSDAKTVSYVYEGEKSYYVSCSPDAEGNGVFLSMPAYYDEILSRNDTVATVKLNFVDIDNDTCPQIDVSKIQNKTYEINNSNGGNIYTISKNSETGITVTSLAPSYTISFIDSTKIEDLSTTTTVTINPEINPEVKILKLSLGGGVTVKALNATSVLLCNTEYIDSYAITKNPFVTVDSATTVSLSSEVKTFDVVSKTDGDNKNWYLAYAGEVDLTLTSNSIPNFTIVDSSDLTDVSKNSYYVGDSVTLKVSPKASPVSSFGAGTTFIWYVNGIQQTSETDSLSLTFGQGDTDVNNKIMCIACLNGEYKSVLAEIKAVEQIALLYSVGESSTYAGYTIISNSTTDITNTMGDFINNTSSSETSNTVIDTFIDSKQNVYTLYQDVGRGYHYSESIFTGKEYETPKEYNISFTEGVTIPTLYQIKKGLDGSIYLLSGIENSYTISSIIKSNTESRTVTPEPKVSSTSISKDVFTGSSRTTFFVDENGNIYYISETTKETTTGETTTTTNKVKLMKQNNGGTSETVTEIMSFDSLGYNVVSVGGILDGKMYYKPGYCPEFTDMRIIDGKLYLLIRHLNCATGYSYSTGCVVCVNLSDNKATVYGWDTNLYNSTSDSYLHDEDTFYGPDKIVAIKPKQIVIADDGVEHDSGCYGKNKQRLVVFDLQENSFDLQENPIIKTITSPDTIQFSYNYQSSSFFN